MEWVMVEPVPGAGFTVRARVLGSSHEYHAGRGEDVTILDLEAEGVRFREVLDDTRPVPAAADAARLVAELGPTVAGTVLALRFIYDALERR